MKKLLCSMLLTLLIVFGAVNCLAAETEDYFIFQNYDFDDHRIGEYPKLFGYHHYDNGFYGERAQWATAHENAEIVKDEKDGNSDNLAAKLNVDPIDDGNDSVARVMLHYYPIKDKGVISFSFKVDDFKVDKIVQINGNANTRTVNYADNKNYWNFIKISNEKVYYNGDKEIASGIKTKTWHRIDFKFDIATKRASVYFDGKETAVALPESVKNITEVQFKFPLMFDGNNSPLYLDDILIYEADDLVDDAILDAQWKKYEDSMFYPGYEFEGHRGMLYNYMAFRKAEGKKFLVLKTAKMFNGSTITDLPAKTYKNGDEIMVPLRAIAEGYGAKVGWQEVGNKVTIEYKGKVMSVTPGERIYYLNGTPSKLLYPVELVDGASCISLDILFKFLEKQYYLEEDILWFDEPRKFDWNMPVNPESTTGAYLGTNSGRGTVEKAMNSTILKTFLFERPSDEEIENAIKTFSPNNQHPRIEFTTESVAKIKEGMKTDPHLKSIIDAVITSAEKVIGSSLVVRGLHDGKRSAYISTVGGYCESLAFGYLFSDDPEQKARFKAEIWRHFTHINDQELFPDWHMQSNSALDCGQGVYGLAVAYDWVDWTDEERQMMVEMFKRNIMDDTLHVMTCPLYYHNHANAYGNGNQELITPGGFSLLATVLYDEDPEYFKDVIRGCMIGSEGGTFAYYPDGEYIEGISYWRFAGTHLPMILKGWQTAFGTSWGRTDIPGVLETATFPFRMRGATTAYAFGDGNPEDAIIPLLTYCADQTDNKSLAQYRKDTMGKSGSWVDVANWVFDTAAYKQGLEVYDTDIMNVSNSTLILKTGWSKADTTVAFHGGTAGDDHGHPGDPGSVQFDMSGVRFGMDLPREVYNLRDLGHYNKNRVSEFWPEGYPLTGGHYYRLKGEGHNVVVANRQYTNIQDPESSDSYDYYSKGTTEFIKTEFSDVSSFGWLDMTNMNKIYQSAVRGVKLDKINNIIEIQDDFTAKEPTDFLWSMHTYAQIEVAEDGKSAILTQNNQKIKATIINDCDFKFEVLPAEFDETYGTRVKPQFESPNFVYGKDHPFYQTHKQACDIKQDARKLAVRTQKDKDIKHFKLAVTFQPYVEGYTPVAEYKSLELWENKDVKRQTLSSVSVDGKPLDIFDRNKYNYSIETLTEKSAIPEITAVPTDSRVQVEVMKATSLPGATNILLKQNGVAVGQYTVLISPINNTEKFHSDKQLPIYAYEVSSEPQTENGVTNLFDGDFTTKFASDEQGGNVFIDLGSVIEGKLKLNIACLNGDKRTENFKIEYSVDGVNFTEAFNGHNSGTTTGLEQFDICNKARYVRVSFYGSSEGTWVSVTELFVSKE